MALELKVPSRDDAHEHALGVKMFHVYADESSDETGSRVVAVAGVVGTVEMWDELVPSWLERTKGIPFHAKDCESGWGDYRNNLHSENHALYRDLIQLLVHSRLAGWGIAIDLAALRSVFPEAPAISYYKGFTEVIEAMTRFAAYYQQSVKFTFDQREESEFNSRFLYQLFRKESEHKAVIWQDVSFANSREEPRLQVADLWTREAMKAMDNAYGPVKRPKRKSWEALEATNRFNIDALGTDWFSNLKEQMPEMQAETGLDMEKYRRWLDAMGLQSSISNMFRFITPGPIATPGNND